jgi:hypothetical protein
MRNRESRGTSAARTQRDIELFLNSQQHLEDVPLKEMEVLEELDRIMDHGLMDGLALVLDHWHQHRPNGMDADDAVAAKPVQRLHAQLQNLLRARLKRLVQGKAPAKHKEVLEDHELDRERFLRSVADVPDLRIAEHVLLAEMVDILDHSLLRGLDLVLGHFLWERSSPADRSELDAVFPVEHLRRLLNELGLARLRDAVQAKMMHAA